VLPGKNKKKKTKKKRRRAFDIHLIDAADHYRVCAFQKKKGLLWFAHSMVV
jgi:hypothetical protein